MDYTGSKCVRDVRQIPRTLGAWFRSDASITCADEPGGDTEGRATHQTPIAQELTLRVPTSIDSQESRTNLVNPTTDVIGCNVKEKVTSPLQDVLLCWGKN
eukprot:scaffold682_cov363-Pavlova_lutheri.AAC.16